MTNPKFTVIVPSYKGGEYLKQCVGSILAQTYVDFELAVLDNCSEDGSVEWLTGLHDSRIKIYRSDSYLSIEDNWARALEIPKNEFMTFFGHDDLMDPNYLEVMNNLVNTVPEAGLYHAHFRLIDNKGNCLRSCMPRPPAETAAEFLSAMIVHHRDTFGTGYVFRSARYDEVGGMPRFDKLLYADFALWLLLMQGSIGATAPEECFSYRLHATNTTATATWESHKKATLQFLAFLKELRQSDPQVLEVIESQKDLSVLFFLQWYQVALVQETRRNRKLDPKVLEEVADAMYDLGLHLEPSLAGLRPVKIREFINRNVLTRLIYNGYTIARYGRSLL